MGVIGYVLLLVVLVGTCALLAHLSRLVRHEGLSFPVDDFDGVNEEDELALKRREEAHVNLPLMVVEDDGSDESGRPSPDWATRATVLHGSRRRLRVVRPHGDLPREVP
ncbi:MAG: hypothetical protein AAB570_01705, partial [Patescibacteria group bacterium]